MSNPESEPWHEDSGDEQTLNRGELQARALSGAKWTLLHTLVSIAVGFGVNILLARLLGVTDFGRLAYLTTVIMIAGLLAEVGLGMGVVQFGSKFHAGGRSASVAALLSKAQGYRLLVIAPVVTVAVLAVVRADPVLVGLAIVVGVWAKAALSGAAIALTLEHKTDRIAQNAMLVNVLTQVGVVAVVLWSRDADAVWATRVVIGTLGVALAVPFIDPAYRRAVFRPAAPRRFPQSFWSYAVPAGIASILGNLVISRSEVLFLTWSDLGVAAGLYAAAFGLASHVFSPAQALVGPLVPAISGLRQIDPGAVGNALRRTLRASSTVVGLLMASALAPVALLIPLVYGSEYESAAPVFVALGLGAGIATACGPLFAFIQARLAGGSMLGINIAALAVNLLLILVLLPILGLWGAVVANIGGVVIRNGMLLLGELRDTSLRGATCLHDLAPLLVSAISCGASVWIGWAIPTGAVLSAAAAALTGPALFVVGLRLMRCGLTTRDLAAVSSAVSSRVGRRAIAVLGMLSHRA